MMVGCKSWREERMKLRDKKNFESNTLKDNFSKESIKHFEALNMPKTLLAHEKLIKS